MRRHEHGRWVRVSDERGCVVRVFPPVNFYMKTGFSRTTHWYSYCVGRLINVFQARFRRLAPRYLDSGSDLENTGITLNPTEAAEDSYFPRLTPVMVPVLSIYCPPPFPNTDPRPIGGTPFNTRSQILGFHRNRTHYTRFNV